MARTQDGRLALVELKAVDNAYPMLGEVTLDPKMPVPELLAERDGAFGAAADATLLARLDLKIGDRVSVGSATFQIRSVVGAEPDKLAGGVGFGPRFLVSEAALRATELLQPGSLVRWIYRVKLAGQRGRRPCRADAGQRRANGVAGSGVGNPHPQQRLAAAGTHHQPLHPVSHAGRPRSPSGRRRRRRQRREKPYRSPPRRHRNIQGRRRHRPRRLYDLSHPGDRARGDRVGDRSRRRRCAALSHRRPVRQIAAAAGGAGAASGSTGVVAGLWPVDRARLRAVAARPRP